MFGKSKLFKSMSRLITRTGTGTEVSESEEATPSITSSGSSEPQNEAQAEKVTTKVDNSKTLERLFAQSKKEDKAEINAGARAYTNKEYEVAIIHYQKAISINPSDGSIYNNIGNVYLRGKNDPQTALPYYVQATTIEPSFNYGWLNLALCQRALGDISSAKTAVANGLNALNSEDGLYEVLIQLQSQLESQLE
ncbi:MAG: tetratricopeptide repeat protein [Desulfosporosinus sp.]|nr:tetratricopeptide repeat protein [Desulfosporosinus sp.]